MAGAHYQNSQIPHLHDSMNFTSSTVITDEIKYPGRLIGLHIYLWTEDLTSSCTALKRYLVAGRPGTCDMM